MCRFLLMLINLQAASLQFFVNPDNNPARTVTTVLKKYMTRTLALNFTAVKDSQRKTAFKDMTFCSCLLGRFYIRL